MKPCVPTMECHRLKNKKGYCYSAQQCGPGASCYINIDKYTDT